MMFQLDIIKQFWMLTHVSTEACEQRDSSFYGIELWYNDINRNIAFNNVSVEYHKPVKRIAGLCTSNSNLLARESARKSRRISII